MQNETHLRGLRILAAADIHGVLNVYEWLARAAKAHAADALVLAGDLFAGDLAAGQREQAKEILPLLKKIPAPIFYLMGNDDSCELECDDEHLRPVHGRRIEWRGYNFVGYQHTLPFMGGIFEKPEEEMAADLLKMEPLLDTQTVLVTHGPAWGILDAPEGSDEHVGSRSLAATLARKPVLAHIHGHIHPAFGRHANRFNVAAAGCKRAMVLEFPALRHTEICE